MLSSEDLERFYFQAYTDYKVPLQDFCVQIEFITFLPNGILFITV